MSDPSGGGAPASPAPTGQPGAGGGTSNPGGGGATPGPSPSPQPTPRPVFTGDPAADGPFGVYQSPVTIPASNGKAATIYGPSNDGGKTLITTGHYPLIVVLPGYQASYTAYEYMTRHLVSWGHVAVGIDFDDGTDHTRNARQVQQTIDWALQAASPLGAIADADKVATAGHSKGGKIAVYAATGDANTTYPQIDFAGDPRIKIVLAWDPVDAGGPPCPIANGDQPGQCRGYAVTPDNVPLTRARMVFFGGLTGDPATFTCTPDGRTHAAFYAAATSTALHVSIPTSGHMDWLTDPTVVGLGKLVCGGNPTADGAAVRRLAQRTQVAWLLKYFGGYDGLDPYIDGAKIQADCAAGALCTVEGKLL